MAVLSTPLKRRSRLSLAVTLKRLLRPTWNALSAFMVPRRDKLRIALARPRAEPLESREYPGDTLGVLLWGIPGLAGISATTPATEAPTRGIGHTLPEDNADPNWGQAPGQGADHLTEA
jgi:hypothetical protein